MIVQPRVALPLLLFALLPSGVANERSASDSHALGPVSASRPDPDDLILVEPSEVGMSEEGLREVDEAIARAVASGVTPGAALAVGRDGRLVRLRGYGRVDWNRASLAADAHSIFDVASLTKAVATTTAALLLVQDGALDLRAPLSTYLPEFRGVGDRRAMTARHLLQHSSGLPEGGPLAGVRDRDDVPRFMARVGLRAAPGRRVEYSDYGMILLGSLVERIAKEPLDLFLRRRLIEPLHLSETGFNPFLWQENEPDSTASAFDPDAATRPLRERIAPTERTRSRGHIRGVVHDPLAARLGGVAGHAGLFSSAHDLARFAQLILDHGRIGSTSILDSGLVAAFTHKPTARSRYTLGWEIARPGGPAGSMFSPRAFGHTGFTGTSLWIDPDQRLFVVLLTSRLNPNASETRHVRLRRVVHDGVQRSIVDTYPVEPFRP